MKGSYLRINVIRRARKNCQAIYMHTYLTLLYRSSKIVFGFLGGNLMEFLTFKKERKENFEISEDREAERLLCLKFWNCSVLLTLLDSETIFSTIN